MSKYDDPRVLSLAAELKRVEAERDELERRLYFAKGSEWDRISSRISHLANRAHDLRDEIGRLLD